MTSISTDPRSGAPRPFSLDDTSAREHGDIMCRIAEAAPRWAATPGAKRAAALRTISDALDSAGADLVDLADAETGLGHARLTGELARTTTQLRMFADIVADGAPPVDPAIAGPDADASPGGGAGALRRCHLPLGPAAVFAASNFPFAFSVAGGDTASALAAGCPVVVKAHPAHPELSLHTARLVKDALSAAGADPAVFTLVSGMEEGPRLVSDPVIRAVAFTGSFAGGRALADLAAARAEPIPFYGEFGSVNPVVVLPAAVGDNAEFAREYLDSLTLGGGQFCTNPGLLIAPRTANLRAAVAEQIAARPATVLLHRGIQAAYTAAADHLRSVPGLTAHESTAPLPDVGFFVRPIVFTLSAATALHHPALIDREYFGPAGLLVEYDSDAELTTLCTRLHGCLVSSIHGGPDSELQRRIIAEASRRSGRVVWNAWPTGVAVAAGQHHGGPFPATSNPLFTSVGPDAIKRFLRPVTFQGLPAELLPADAQR
ncbi:aldehyde dehydrogenase family protein [Mycolicibacterium sp. S2-37]|uniref:aldehyde dehydrogenase family protein n=1 Tax=Mycolicibacterium sp. S2-37 TaxID=2810297 RepID=UPI001A9468B0|nr:aldehyde dehydrogenase family protein [Mycolicibacterium sp. S2-37]MBO0680447.1 aldehyde dehydrogenase family protein [Mycolicibacterium sp. S2-37]